MCFSGLPGVVREQGGLLVVPIQYRSLTSIWAPSLRREPWKPHYLIMKLIFKNNNNGICTFEWLIFTHGHYLLYPTQYYLLRWVGVWRKIMCGEMRTRTCMLLFFLTFCEKSYFLRILKKKVTKSRPKVRVFTNFVTYVKFVVHVYLLVPNNQLCMLYGHRLSSCYMATGYHHVIWPQVTITTLLNSSSFFFLVIFNHLKFSSLGASEWWGG